MAEVQNTKLPEIRWCRKPPYSAIDQLRLIEGIKGDNTIFQFKGNNFWYLGICLSGHKSTLLMFIGTKL